MGALQLYHRSKLNRYNKEVEHEDAVADALARPGVHFARRPGGGKRQAGVNADLTDLSVAGRWADLSLSSLLLDLSQGCFACVIQARPGRRLSFSLFSGMARPARAWPKNDREIWIPLPPGLKPMEGLELSLFACRYVEYADRVPQDRDAFEAQLEAFYAQQCALLGTQKVRLALLFLLCVPSPCPIAFLAACSNKPLPAASAHVHAHDALSPAPQPDHVYGLWICTSEAARAVLCALCQVEGEPLDLFAIFGAVARRGGYEAVTISRHVFAEPFAYGPSCALAA